MSPILMEQSNHRKKTHRLFHSNSSLLVGDVISE